MFTKLKQWLAADLSRTSLSEVRDREVRTSLSSAPIPLSA